MDGTVPRRDEIGPVLEAATGAARSFLEGLDDDPVLRPDAAEAAASFGGPLPDEGNGAPWALKTLISALDGATRSPGPRFFHFVTGGVTPAALGADWLASALDQNALGWVASPLAARLEQVALNWLKELFGLPPEWGGVLTTGATQANVTALAAARRWCGLQRGVDVERDGLAAAGDIPVFASGYIHSSAYKALGLLGFGKGNVSEFRRDAAGRVDLAALETALSDVDGPAIVIATAGEVNAGDFDPVAEMADLAAAHGAWLHVDGAFGLFARLSPRVEHLAAGVERAHSVIADGHKWLNVPYDCGFAFVRDHTLLPGAFAAEAAYLMRPDDERPNFMHLGPDMSRRARAFAVWATLAAYGRSGHRALVERHLDLAQLLARKVDAAGDLERLAEVPLNIVLFRLRPPGAPDESLDDLNRRAGEAVLADGRIYFGTTVHEGRVAFRPAIVNWRTRPEDVEMLVEVVREIGAEL